MKPQNSLLEALITALHYGFPAASFLYLTLSLVITVCTLQSQSLRVRDQKVRRDLILGLILAVSAAYVSFAHLVYGHTIWTTNCTLMGYSILLDHVLRFISRSLKRVFLLLSAPHSLETSLGKVLHQMHRRTMSYVIPGHHFSPMSSHEHELMFKNHPNQVTCRSIFWHPLSLSLSRPLPFRMQSFQCGTPITALGSSELWQKLPWPSSQK